MGEVINLMERRERVLDTAVAIAEKILIGPCFKFIKDSTKENAIIAVFPKYPVELLDDYACQIIMAFNKGWIKRIESLDEGEDLSYGIDDWETALRIFLAIEAERVGGCPSNWGRKMKDIAGLFRKPKAQRK